MTKQEAIKWLEEMLPTFKKGSKEWEVTTMAIEALQFQDIMVNNPKSAKPAPEVCKNCKDNTLDELKEILTFYSFDVPMVYGDGEETVEKAVLIEEVGHTIRCIKDGFNGEPPFGKHYDATTRKTLQDEWISVSKPLPTPYSGNMRGKE